MSQPLRAIVLAILAIIGGAAAASSGGQAPETGSITGHVKLITRVRGERLPSAVYPSRGVNRNTPPPVSEIHNVVVYVKDAVFRGTLPLSTGEIHQEHETFVPHVLAITLGSTVKFPNGDPFFHNVFSLSRAATFDLGRYPKDETRSATFRKPGLVKVYCRIHSQMSATIMVLDHPYFATPGEDGRFTIPNVPAGQYTIVGWHERVGERTAPIRVEAGKASQIELTLPVEDPL